MRESDGWRMLITNFSQFDYFKYITVSGERIVKTGTINKYSQMYVLQIFLVRESDGWRMLSPPTFRNLIILST
jgi:hypothetical protein